MIQRALYLRPALERLLAIDNSRKFSKARVPLTLSHADWKTLESLEKILCLFVDATEFARGSSYPTLSSQLPYYQFLQNSLHELIAREHDRENNQDPDSPGRKIWAAADDAYWKLNQYWVKTDSNTGQVIATILDPRMKLQLFRNLEWEPDWIQNAREKYIRIFNTRYARLPRLPPQPTSLPGEPLVVPPGPIADRPNAQAGETHRNRTRYEELVFGSREDVLDEDLLESQVDIYLREPRVDRNMDITQW